MYAAVTSALISASRSRRGVDDWNDQDLVTVRMLQGMAGERLTLEPGDLYQIPSAQAKIWAELGIAELVEPASRGATAREA